MQIRQGDAGNQGWSFDRRIPVPWLVSLSILGFTGFVSVITVGVSVQSSVSSLTESFKEQKVSSSTQFDKLNDKIEKVNNQLVDNSNQKTAVDNAQTAKIEVLSERVQNMSAELSILKGRDGYQTKR